MKTTRKKSNNFNMLTVSIVSACIILGIILLVIFFMKTDEVIIREQVGEGVYIEVEDMVAQTSKKVETGNWLDLSYQVFNEEGEALTFNFCEPLPEFPGGYDSLAKFITNTLKYPPKAIHDSIQGKVWITFIVDWKGKVSNVEILKGARYDLDSACIHTIGIMPDWETTNSTKEQKISTKFTLPINFTIE